jgi:hypothetical protein
MSAVTIDTTTTTTKAGILSRPVWQVGLAATVLAAVAAEAFAAVARSLDVPMEVGGEAIPGGGYATVTLMWGVLGTIAAVVLARKASRAATIFGVGAVVLAVLSFGMPFMDDATAATRVALNLDHALVAAIIITPITRRLAR